MIAASNTRAAQLGARRPAAAVAPARRVVVRASAGGADDKPAAPAAGRRRVLLGVTAAPLLVSLPGIGTDDPKTVFNSVVKGYGLPGIRPTPGYRVWENVNDPYAFEYPKSWVSRGNTSRNGVIISDFENADKIAVEIVDVPTYTDDIVPVAIEAVVSPGNDRLNADRLIAPPASDVKRTNQTNKDGLDYVYLEFPSETVTVSGYQVRRQNYAAAAVKDGKLYTINASVREDKLDDEKRGLLQHVVESFRVKN